jgi:hypothetical protein
VVKVPVIQEQQRHIRSRLESFRALVAVLFVVMEGTGSQPVAIAAASTPAPASSRCWIYGQVNRLTDLAYDSQHVSSSERREIEKWAAAVPLADRSLVSWMRDAQGDGSLYVFVARPLYRPHTDGYYPWLAINTNALIDPVLCSIYTRPTVSKK